MIWGFSQPISDNMEEAVSGVKGELAVKIFGDDLKQLEEKADEIVGAMRNVRGIEDLGVFHVIGQPNLDFSVDQPPTRAIRLWPLTVASAITWDMPGRSMNVLTPEAIEELNGWSTRSPPTPRSRARSSPRARTTFSGGADLTMLQGMAHEYARVAKAEGEEAAMRVFFDRSRQLSLIYRKLETCGKPFAAAINGVCLGGAFELALACHYRVVADNDKARVGLPEIKVGLFPGAGGTQRVARLMPTPDALQMLFKRRSAEARRGEEDGARPRRRAGRRNRRARQGLGEGQSGRQGAVGRSEIQGPVGQGVLSRRHDDLAARQRDLPPRDLRQLSRRQGDPGQRVRGPATADGPGAGGREPLLRQDPALEGSGGDDPLAVRLDGRTQQGRAPARRRARRRTCARSACSAPASWAPASPMSRRAPGSTSC